MKRLCTESDRSSLAMSTAQAGLIQLAVRSSVLFTGILMRLRVKLHIASPSHTT